MRREKNENEIIEHLIKRYAVPNRALKKGIGDDAAVWLPAGAREFWSVTTDMLVEEVDFRREWTTPRELGRKSIAVNLSDLGAMGAVPRFFTVSLGMPANVTNRWIREFYDGLTSCGGEHGAVLAGGDLSGADKITISITAFGESENRKVVYRSGGRPGDLLYVTGTPGKSAAGLKLLQRGILRSSSSPRLEALRAHRTPEPRCAIGRWLAQSGNIRCMMDVSDGLSADLPRMCAASGTNAEIFAEKIPVFAESALWGCDPLELALSGGEDYELLFAVPRAKKHFLKTLPPDFPPVTHIGTMLEGNAKVWITGAEGTRRPLPVRGFDHFRGKEI
ncbi:MAG: thiamine-phosphate kinase [Acidobacteria bacterium]|nr:thiamine-phosphate kinase [Acidobacteriota bacterium]